MITIIIILLQVKFLNQKARLLHTLDAFSTDASPLKSKFQGVVDGTAFMIVWKRHIQPYLNTKGEFGNSSAFEQNLSQGEVNTQVLSFASYKNCQAITRELDDETTMKKAIQDHFLGRLYGYVVSKPENIIGCNGVTKIG